ncbi:MAG: FtsX-like permease family protein [Vicinamibacteraceae bacterium]|nr:FtsX-like permease family protein [Vicinamibacteraceae bacterium]
MCGLFGVTYFSVRQRLREFGVRTALGASRGQVMRLVLGEGVRVAAPGIVLGLVAAMGVARALSRMLVATSPTDVPTLAITLLVQAAVTLAACALPAWQASRVDPLVVLREG